MALAGQLKTLVKKAIDTVDDLAVLITYYDVTPGAYDVASDTVTNTSTTYASVRAVLVKLTDEEVAWFPADAIGQKALIAYNDLPITPEPHDYLTIAGVTWQIFKSKAVPGNSLHILYLRKT